MFDVYWKQDGSNGRLDLWLETFHVQRVGYSVMLLFQLTGYDLQLIMDALAGPENSVAQNAVSHFSDNILIFYGQVDMNRLESV